MCVPKCQFKINRNNEGPEFDLHCTCKWLTTHTVVVKQAQYWIQIAHDCVGVSRKLMILDVFIWSDSIQKFRYGVSHFLIRGTLSR